MVQQTGQHDIFSGTDKKCFAECWDGNMMGVSLRKNRKTARGNSEKRLIF